ncbi:MAG TPA: hypothetical protein VN030_09400 [Cellvibrio sp.]|nr:hypothetical protein [Cellvibrio sp.]
MKKIPSLLLTSFIAIATLPAFAASTDASEQGHKGRSHMPPQVAVDACKGLNENDACQFSGRNSELVSGVCDTPRGNKDSASLVCRPDRHTKDTSAKEEKTSN